MSSEPGAVFAYLGPETVLPIASTVIALVGLLLVCWRHAVAWAMAPLRRVRGGKDRPQGSGDTDQGSGAEGQKVPD